MKRLLLSVLFATAFIPTRAMAWTPKTDARIARKAISLAPSDLQLVLKQFAPQYNDGLRRAAADEGNDIHVYFVTDRDGKLRERLESDTRGIVRMLRGNSPMTEIVERLAILTHLVVDANDPFHVSNEDERIDDAVEADFTSYVERASPRISVVLYTLDANLPLGPYLDAMVQRTAKLMPLIAEEYFRGNSRHGSGEFDDRSTAFGVASLCYSHAITDLVNLYYYIWKEAGGNVRSAQSLRGHPSASPPTHAH